MCNTCQCKSVRTRYPNCPLPTCPNPKDRAKRLRNIPPRLYELAPEVRDPIMQEFQIPAQATRCCSACLMRIRRKLDPHVNLTDEERRTDGDESDVSTSSCDEREPGGSDTASVESPQAQRHNSLSKDLVQKPSPLLTANKTSIDVNNSTAPDTTTAPNLAVSVASSGGGSGIRVSNTQIIAKSDERLLPPLGHAPKKQKTSEEYDSSATETADEENENSPANRQSPKVILNNTNSSNTGSCSSSSVVVTVASGLGPPASSVNGPLPLSAAGQDPKAGHVRPCDLRGYLDQVIERTLKNNGPPPAKPAQSNNQSNKVTNPHLVGMAGKQPLQLSLDSSAGGNNNSGSTNNNRRNDVISSSTGSSANNASSVSNSSNNNSNNDVTIVREYRNDSSIKHQPQAHGQPLIVSGGSASANSVQNLNVRQSPASQAPPSTLPSTQASIHPENLATLSVVNSYMPVQHLPPPSHGMLHHQQHDIKATITPVLKTGKTSTPPHVVVAASPDTIIYATSRNNEPEPQTLDLSIKKPSRDGSSPHNSSGSTSSTSGIGSENSGSGCNVTSRHQQPPPSSGVKHVGNAPSMYRGAEPSPLIGAPPNLGYLYHHHPATVGVGKVPPPGSLFVSQVPVPMSVTQPPGAPVGSSTQRCPPSQPPPSQPQISSQHGKSVGSGVNKMPPKLSPQMILSLPPHSHKAPSPSQQQQQQPQQLLVGPTGSITHGTPVNNATQQIIVHPAPSGATLSPKFDNLLRQTPPSAAASSESNKLGSITQGTPIHLPAHLDNKRAYEYTYKSSQRQSPAQQQQQHHAPPPQQQSSPQGLPQNAYVGPYSRPYAVEQPPVLSTRQIVMHDYITSQQMQGQQQRNVPRSGSANSAGTPVSSGKESPSPRNSASGLVYYDKERGRTEYSSRASPADHVNRYVFYLSNVLCTVLFFPKLI